MKVISRLTLTGQLSGINVPTLITCGEFDEFTSESAQYFQSRIPGSLLSVFRDASHMHHVEKEEEYRQLVGEFIKKQET